MGGHSLKIGLDARAIYKTIDGIGRYSLNLIRSLASIDDANEYVVFKNRGNGRKITEAPNFREVIVDFRHLSLRSVAYLPPIVKEFKLDVFHSPFFICPVWGVENIVLTVHDLMALTFPRFFSGRNPIKEKCAYFYHRVFVPLSIRKAKRIIAVSESTKKSLIYKLRTNPEKIETIYEGVDNCFKKSFSQNELESFRSSKSLPPNYLLYIGNMKPYKNITLILAALTLLKSNGNLKCKMVMAGKKDRFFPLVYGEVVKQQLLDDVIFLDYVSDRELPLLFKNARMFLFPSLSEGFGLPPLEAMSLGVPTIVSNVSSLPEVVGDGALLVDPHDPNDLAGAISKVLNDSGLRKHLQRKGVERSETFSWQKAAKKTLKIYCEIGENRFNSSSHSY